jgi:hypothetical protein
VKLLPAFPMKFKADLHHALLMTASNIYVALPETIISVSMKAVKPAYPQTVH